MTNPDIEAANDVVCPYCGDDLDEGCCDHCDDQYEGDEEAA